MWYWFWCHYQTLSNELHWIMLLLLIDGAAVRCFLPTVIWNCQNRLLLLLLVPLQSPTSLLFGGQTYRHVKTHRNVISVRGSRFRHTSSVAANCWSEIPQRLPRGVPDRPLYSFFFLSLFLCWTCSDAFCNRIKCCGAKQIFRGNTARRVCPPFAFASCGWLHFHTMISSPLFLSHLAGCYCSSHSFVCRS